MNSTCCGVGCRQQWVCAVGLCCVMCTTEGLFCGGLKGSIQGWSIAEERGFYCRDGFHSLGSLVWFFP